MIDSRCVSWNTTERNWRTSCDNDCMETKRKMKTRRCRHLTGFSVYLVVIKTVMCMLDFASPHFNWGYSMLSEEVRWKNIFFHAIYQKRMSGFMMFDCWNLSVDVSCCSPSSASLSQIVLSCQDLSAFASTSSAFGVCSFQCNPVYTMQSVVQLTAQPHCPTG